MVSLRSFTTTSTDLSFQKPGFFGIYFEFSAAKIILKNQYLSHSESKSCQINSIKSCSSRSSQQLYQRRIPTPSKFSG
jgi:hypothetical protein